jgi:hypothetical protein
MLFTLSYILHVLVVSFLPLIVVSVLLEPSSFAVLFFCGNQSETPCTKKMLFAFYAFCQEGAGFFVGYV